MNDEHQLPEPGQEFEPAEVAVEGHAPAPWLEDAGFSEELHERQAFDYDVAYNRSALEFELPPEPEKKGSAPLPRAQVRTGRTRALAEVKAEPIVWLWPGRIALGSVTILDGDPGVGKTTLAIDLCARVSTGRAMPMEAKPHLPASGTLLVSAEDNPALTIRPRADAALGDLKKIFVALDHCWLPVELPKLQQMIHDTSARLVVLDPGIAFFDQKVDSNSDQQVRRVVQGLSDVAAATQSAIIFVRHLNKAQRSAAMYRGGGSIAIAAAARNCLLARIPGRNMSPILASYKSNLSATPKTISYSVVEDPIRRVSRIQWDTFVDISADDALAADEGGRSGRRTTSGKSVDPTTVGERMKQLEDGVMNELLQGGPDGVPTSTLRLKLKVRADRLYAVLSQMLSDGRARVEGTGPQRRYHAIAQVADEEEA